MAGKEDAPSKANGVAKPDEKPLDKGKGKADDAKDKDTKEEPKLDKDGKPVKLLPPGTAHHHTARARELMVKLQRS